LLSALGFMCTLIWIGYTSLCKMYHVCLMTDPRPQVCTKIILKLN
jgi:hypothetical protein